MVNQALSKTLVKELVLRKAASLVILVVNFLTSIFHRFWLQFSIHTTLFHGTSFLEHFSDMFLFSFILFSLKAFKTKSPLSPLFRREIGLPKMGHLSGYRKLSKGCLMLNVL